jgi:hypothetical protein
MKKYIALAFVFFACQQTQGMDPKMQDLTEAMKQLEIEDCLYIEKSNELHEIIQFNQKFLDQKYSQIQSINQSNSYDLENHTDKIGYIFISFHE